MRPTRIRDLKMEIFERIKTILLKPKEEWAVIEVENAPHTNVLTKYLLILALIPALAFFANEYLKNRSILNKYIEAGTVRIENRYTSNNYYGNSEFSVERKIAMNKEIAEFEEKAKEDFRIMYPFGSTKWNIIFALCLFAVIVGGAYISAAIINALSNQFGAGKDFNRAFSLVAYSYTPFCIAGVLYVVHSFASLVPYAGLYGLYLLYLGIDSQLKPAVNKKITCLVISAIAIVGIWLLLARVVAPEIQKRVMTEEYIGTMEKKYRGNDIFKIDAITRKSIEKQMESELENHKY